MTLEEIARQYMGDFPNFIAKRHSFQPKFETLVKRSSRYPVTAQYEYISHTNKNRYFFCYSAFKRSDWKAPHCNVVGVFEGEGGKYAVVSANMKQAVIIFTPHFFARYRERILGGEDIHGEGFDKKKLRSKVGLVFQYPEHQLFEETVLSDVMFGPRNLGLSEEECRKRATEALRHVGMEERYFEQSPFDLSGGQKRRAAIAGVLAMRPEILVLDEPTAGLDPRGRDEILGLITDMRIMVMRRGKLVYNDVPAEIFKHSAELEEMGLSAPQITYIMEYLQTRGLRVNADMLTVEEAAAEILKHRGELHV